MKEELLLEAKKQNDLYKHYKKLADEAYKLHVKYSNEYGEANADFKIGDIIEYQTKIGFNPKKTVTRRMKVRHISFDGTLSVSGNQANSKGEINYRNQSTAYFKDGRDVFVKVLKLETK